MTLTLSRFLTAVTCGFFVAAATLAPAEVSGQAPRAAGSTRTLLAVFAHPDDETIAGPLLAKYAAEKGTRVVLALITNGDKGVTPFAGIPAGEALAAVRAKEAACSARELGIEQPVLFGLPDGGLTTMPVLQEAATKLRALLADLRPEVIVTWGPDGGYGHPDHRLVSALVTQIVQAGETRAALYYAGLPKSRLESDATKALKFPAPFAPVIDELLNARVPYTPEDLTRAGRSLACHTSQFTPETMKVLTELTDRVHGGRMHLRSWAGGPMLTDLFGG